MPPPSKVPYHKELSDLMYSCWIQFPADRPGFSQVQTFECSLLNCRLPHYWTTLNLQSCKQRNFHPDHTFKKYQKCARVCENLYFVGVMFSQGVDIQSSWNVIAFADSAVTECCSSESCMYISCIYKYIVAPASN